MVCPAVVEYNILILKYILTMGQVGRMGQEFLAKIILYSTYSHTLLVNK